MRAILESWINAADNFRHLQHFAIRQLPIDIAHVVQRSEDYYLSLVGELFDCITNEATTSSEWAVLGNAFLQFSSETTSEQLKRLGINKDEATLYSAASFYFGDYPASACLAMRLNSPIYDDQSHLAACYDFLARPSTLTSETALAVVNAVRDGRLNVLNELIADLEIQKLNSIQQGPDEWVAIELLVKLISEFANTNLRAVLPDGQNQFWTPLVHSLIERHPSTWEFFPSQKEAIERGLLFSEETFSLQMPTGAGKTTLCETVLYSHLLRNPEQNAIMLVPYRSLASELRGSLVRRLGSLGIPSRSIYGGTVPFSNEVQDLAGIRAVVATPESLSGFLGAEREFADQISLVICDEGHLLDGDGRGIGLELLLARLKTRAGRPVRFIFISAIVPNISEINNWLGGSNETLVTSDYKPAIAEYAVLEPVGKGAARAVDLNMHPHEQEERQFTVSNFLNRQDFQFLNPTSGRPNTLNFSSVKSQSIAAARKVLPMGGVAIFAANKRGNQGAIGLAKSLIEQLDCDLPLPKPIDYVDGDAIQKAHQYLAEEYGVDWIGTQCLHIGAVLHHGDIPQESREVLESIIRSQGSRLVICTSTLAEGVNLPIRTLVLYSVQRRQMGGQIINMLARDIKNLVGRAGRAGANTKGLVICANPNQWQFVAPVAMQEAGEPVNGSLLALIRVITRLITDSAIVISNDFLERYTLIHPLVDGVDSTLIELLSEEIGEAEFIELAATLAGETFAALNVNDDESANLRTVFEFRAGRMIELRRNGKLSWARETGAKTRLIDSVEQDLKSLNIDWQNIDGLTNECQNAIYGWAWSHEEIKVAARESFRLDEDGDVETLRDLFFEVARLWVAGHRTHEIANLAGLSVDDYLAVQSRGIGYSLQTMIEQGISLLTRELESENIQISATILHFPEQLKYGCANSNSRILAGMGVRHRNAYVQLGTAIQRLGFAGNQNELKVQATRALIELGEEWAASLGDLVYRNTLADLSRA